MCTNNDPGRIDGAIIPRVNILVNGQLACALIGSDCTQTLVGPNHTNWQSLWIEASYDCRWKNDKLRGRDSPCIVFGWKTIEVLGVLTKKMVLGVDIIVRTDVLKYFKFSLNYGHFSIAAAVDSLETTRERLAISGNNFEVIFDGEKWLAKWDWKNELLLRSRTDFYKMDKAVYSRFKPKAERWIENGWFGKTNCSGDGAIPFDGSGARKEGQSSPSARFSSTGRTLFI